ncbi:transcription factor 20 isoform X2 [Antennarius striatus]|uniref:transcription factor 20 isoform X2 n=1 Tax=Antennarius striatus TaxID=241820 RepID=UPI0035AEFD48
MDQPPGSSDELQPEDLSTSSLTAVIDLTRNGEDRLLSTTSLDALRMVKSPGWYPNSGPSNPGLPFSEAGSSDITLQSGDQVQPDNAFSHTTVTLSYVSRSCVFATHDSLSRHSPLCGVPSISSLSLHPPSEGLEDAGYSLKQNQLEQAEATVGLDPFQLLSRAQVGPEDDDAVCQTPESLEVNSGVVSRGGDADERIQVQEEHGLSQENRLLENGRGESWAGSGVPRESSQETVTPVTEEEGEKGDSEVVFLVSKRRVIPDILRSLNKEYVSPLEDPISPSVTSQDDVEDVFVLPQASNSPSGDNSYLETTDGAAWDDLTVKSADCTTRSDLSDENEQNVQTGRAALEHVIDLTRDSCSPGVVENQPKTVVPRVNGNAKTLQRSLEEKKPPAQLDAIAMNIDSSRFNCLRAGKRASGDSKLTRVQKKDSRSVGKRADRVEMKRKTLRSLKGGKSNNCNKDSTSDSQINRSGRAPPGSPSPKSSPLVEDEPEVCPTGSTPTLPPSKPPKKSRGKGNNAAARRRSPPAKTKAARAPRRRRKKHTKVQLSPLFAPKEPEIRLKYVNYKEEKRDLSSESFSPFVHVRRREAAPALCTVVNYPEEVRTPRRRGQQAHAAAGFVSAVIPTTSCLHLGRASTRSPHQRSLVCCLCGMSANAMDLGDLHGPYYPEGHQPSTGTPARTSGLKEDESFSDSESSSCSVRDRGRTRPPGPRPPRALRPGAQLKQVRQRWGADGTGSPAAKRVRPDPGSGPSEDWFSPPVLPLEACEYWIHEDCSVWSTGVFLVKGKVYGLEEAMKVAQETTCSSCCDPGATLGCFFKSCPNKYHYRCAVESGCVLLEDNFSMKCKKHKNKTFNGPPGNRWDGR